MYITIHSHIDSHRGVSFRNYINNGIYISPLRNLSHRSFESNIGNLSRVYERGFPCKPPPTPLPSPPTPTPQASWGFVLNFDAVVL